MYKVTPRGLEQQLKDACEEATRSVARSLQHTEIYGLRTDMHVASRVEPARRTHMHRRASLTCGPRAGAASWQVGQEAARARG